jgi:hydrogenase nickel incorporation protein HypA/HybF
LHELPATQGILATALETARGAGADRVLAIDIVVGELSSIVDDSVQFYFDVMSRDTAAAGAVLRFHREPGRAECVECRHSYEVRPPLDPFCPACRQGLVRVTGGQEFYIESIEVDDEGTGDSGDPEGERLRRG